MGKLRYSRFDFAGWILQLKWNSMPQSLAISSQIYYPGLCWPSFSVQDARYLTLIACNVDCDGSITIYYILHAISSSISIWWPLHRVHDLFVLCTSIHHLITYFLQVFLQIYFIKYIFNRYVISWYIFTIIFPQRTLLNWATAVISRSGIKNRIFPFFSSLFLFNHLSFKHSHANSSLSIN